MKLTHIAPIVLLGSLFVLSAACAESTPETASSPVSSQLFEHYEAVRQALVADHTDGVAERGRAIQKLVADLERDWSAQRAGVKTEMADDAKIVLPELRQAADDLAAAETLDGARDAFYALSKPMVRLRATVEGELPVVAYCSMAKRSWLQPEGDLGNPYYGQSMLSCGEVVEG